MNRSLTLLIAAAAVVSMPLPALAQAWTATGVASTPQMRSQSRAASPVLDRATIARLTAAPLRQSSQPLKLAATIEPTDVPDVDIRAKDAWSDDQGLRVGPTKLAFKRRF